MEKSWHRKRKTKTSPKISNKGIHCIMVGCYEKHSVDTCRMHYPLSKTICESRDATWLHRFCYSPQPRTNFDSKVGESVELSDDVRRANLDAIDDAFENKDDSVENYAENENSEEIDGKNNETTVDSNEWTNVPKKV